MAPNCKASGPWSVLVILIIVLPVTLFARQSEEDYER